MLAGSGPFYEQWKILFYIALGLSLVYIILCVPGIKHAKSEFLIKKQNKFRTLGINKLTGSPAKFPDKQFFLGKSLNILGSALWMLIMKSLIDTFICDFSTESSWTLYRDSDVVCLSDEHIIYMCLSIVGLALYYPISTFLYPNLQFQDKGLDLKYNPSFLVLLIQLKLIISGSDSFFKSFDGQQLPLCSMLCLSFLSLKFQPCLIQIFNLLDACIYLIIATMCAASLIVVVNSDLSLYCLIGFIIISIILVIIMVQFQFIKKSFIYRLSYGGDILETKLVLIHSKQNSFSVQESLNKLPNLERIQFDFTKSIKNLKA